ncbi:RluA family pseudouridine synthase [Maridesulfovibrio ferrireducens]|uniref:RluA family pseudouridine synthase n=1 Tax=Maridesulfovibrio ferrireducens TaxID=246191 RepID=UPI001A1E0B87|nr:RluA family pseudouridine synthase [Maridesulfovibrio ferrireducens]MBI9110731.1 RluA family pseudouridine synthase [Maridesulfovibrio ferrireducens]
MPAEFVTVTSAEAGQKLVRFLERRVDGEVPRSAVMRWIRKGNVRVDKGRCKPFDLVKEGQIVRIPPYRADEPAEKVSREPLEIIYEDENYLAINKPAGLPSQGGTGHDDSVVDRLLSMYADFPFKPAPAHRLDRDTSGVLLAGKSHHGQRALSDMFASGEGGKYYLALVRGDWISEGAGDDGWVEMHDLLEKKEENGNEKMVTGSGKEAHASVLSLGKLENQTLLLIKLHTGRTHQIRVQLSSRGFPIIGDSKYGGGNGAMKLHCWRIETPWFTAQCSPHWDDVFLRQEHINLAENSLF